MHLDPIWPVPVEMRAEMKMKADSRAIVHRQVARRQDELLDEALMETFPASDPVSVMRLT